MLLSSLNQMINRYTWAANKNINNSSAIVQTKQVENSQQKAWPKLL